LAGAFVPAIGFASFVANGVPEARIYNSELLLVYGPFHRFDLRLLLAIFP